jgi:hypothetical protein
MGTIGNQPFPSERDLDPIALLVRFLLHLGRKRDCAHDAIAKLLVENSLVRIAVVLDDFEQSVDEWIPGWHLQEPTPIGITLEQVCKPLFADLEQPGQFLNILRGGTRLPVEQSGHGHLGATQVLTDLLKVQLLLLLGLEEVDG